jgi:hypothetical protein
MSWDRRADGGLRLEVLKAFEMAVAEGEALALRVEFAEVQEQLRDQMAQSAKQLVMSLDVAETLGRQLVEQARLARGSAGEA